jgi:magnesium-protoporphyrin IX monomethyl ester (oxidative) cyclase
MERNMTYINSNGNNTDVLLVTAPSIMDITFSSAKSLYKPVEPLGLLYMAGSLVHEGIPTKILDCNAEGLSINQSIEKIKQINPLILGISCLTQEAFLVEKLLKSLRKVLPNVKIVMGNTHSKYFHEYFLKNKIADVVIHGEGEIVMPELVKVLKNGGDMSQVKGISYIDKNNQIIKTAYTLISDLDSIPFPAWNLINLKNYRSFFYYNFNPKKTRIMITSRGCPIGCSFCTIHEGQKVRYQSPERIIKEIKFLVKEYGTTHIEFLYPMFLANRSRVTAFCELLLKEKINIKWACEMHANYANEELFKLMKKTGCETVFIGIETGDDGLLKNVGKKTTVAQIKKAVWMAHNNGLKPVGLFMLGLPGETEELSLKTINFSLSLPLDMAVFSITVPYPGSRLFEDIREQDKSFDIYNWDGYSNTGVLGKNPPVWNPPELSYEKLKELQSLAMRKFHLRPKMIWRHLKTLRYATLEDIKALISVAFTISKK